MTRFWWTLVIPCALAACQPMYGAKPQKLRTPDELQRPTEAAGSGAPVVVVPVMDEHCGIDRTVRSSVTPTRSVAEAAARKSVDASREPDAKKRAHMALDAVEGFRAVLAKEPFNHQATLGLAVAYDMLRRKQCALNMLARIATLAKHPVYKDRAEQLADDVKNTPRWFVHYRTEAERAVGR